MRVFHYGESRIVATPIAPDVWMIRRHTGVGLLYDRMTVVTEMDGGRALHLTGWIGNPRDIPG